MMSSPATKRTKATKSKYQETSWSSAGLASPPAAVPSPGGGGADAAGKQKRGFPLHKPVNPALGLTT